MKYLIKSAYPCLIMCNNSSVELEENDLLEIEDEKEMFVYPQIADTLPFCVNLKNPIENRFFSVINRQNQKILLLEKQQKVAIFQKETLYFPGKTICIQISENMLCFESSSCKIQLPINHSCKNYKVFKLKHFACLQCDQNFYAFNTKTDKITHFCGICKLEKEILTVEKTIPDSANRKKTSSYKFEDDIVLIDEKILSNAVEGNEKLLPFQFLEAVKAKDTNFAFNSLSATLQQQLEKSQILEFFGNFSAFLPVSENEFILLCPSKNKYVSFSVLGGKIQDISLDEI